MPDDLHTRVIAEIAKTGFPLELRAAALLRDRGCYVAHSVYYIDKDEQKGRELDLRSLKNQFYTEAGVVHAVRHVLAIECKKSNSRPWVFFCSEPVSYDQNVGDLHGIGYRGSWFRGGHRQWRAFQRQHPWFSQESRGRAFFEPFSGGGGDGNPTIVKALLGSIKGLLALKESGFGARSAAAQPNIAFYYPVVILEGDLFTAHYRDGDLVVEPADSIPVCINYRSPSYSEEEQFTVLVVRDKAFPAAMDALDAWLLRASKHLQKHPAVFDWVRPPRAEA